jgi:hypothetical protein
MVETPKLGVSTIFFYVKFLVIFASRFQNIIKRNLINLYVMIKQFLALVFAAALITSCGNTGTKTADVKTTDKTAAEKVEFAALVANPDNFLGKNIVVEGKVVHVCMETGKKLFIVGENPDVRLYIQAGEEMPKFPMELMGSTVVVEGKITKPIAAAMPGEHKGMGMEGEKKAEGAAKTAAACETETALAGQTALADVVMEYTSHVVK